jgi:hypothetical protein
MRKPLPSAGFASPAGRTLGAGRRNAVFAELMTTVALAISILVAATVVSIGVARADVASNVIDNEGSVFALALLLGLFFIGMGSLTALSLPHSRHKRTHS